MTPDPETKERYRVTIYLKFTLDFNNHNISQNTFTFRQFINNYPVLNSEGWTFCGAALETPENQYLQSRNLFFPYAWVNELNTAGLQTQGWIQNNRSRNLPLYLAAQQV